MLRNRPPTPLRRVLVQVDVAESNGHSDFTWRVSVSFAWRGEWVCKAGASTGASVWRCGGRFRLGATCVARAHGHHDLGCDDGFQWR